MRWRKRGRVYVPDGRLEWARHHAFPPTPHRLDGERLRVYIASLDDANVGRVGYVDVLLERPSEIVAVAERPVLDVGEPGAFDESGVVPTCALPVGDELWLYYTGYRRGANGEYTQLLGLAVSRDGGESFERHGPEPVLVPSAAEAETRASAFVQRAGEGFRMYYSAGAGWVDTPRGRLPVYDIRTLESPDGATWGGEGRACVGLRGDEHAIARPWLWGDTMLYSVRTTARDYRIGLARTRDGVHWERQDEEAGIDVSDSGWDSLSVAYGSIVEHRSSTYLFHCGNERGLTGFGYAELDER